MLIKKIQNISHIGLSSSIWKHSNVNLSLLATGNKLFNTNYKLYEKSYQIKPNSYFLRTFYSSKEATKKYLKILEKNANKYPNDPVRQFVFLQELNKYYPELVIRRIDETNFIMDESIIKEYITALNKVKNMDQEEINDIVKKLAAQRNFIPRKAVDNTNSLESLQVAGNKLNSSTMISGSGKTPTDPVYVSMVGKNIQKNTWKTIRSLLVTFLVLTSLSALIDDKALGGKMTGKSKIMSTNGTDKRFDDVQGVDEAKEELEEIVQYLKDPKKFTRLGGKLPKGVLLTGPPGTGKTLLARAIAGEAKVPFFYASGSEFEEMFVGVGARRVRDLFSEAKKKSPCIIFIDEIDAIGGKRQSRDQAALKMTLNQLLVELDGFGQNTGIIVIGATNFPDGLDTALVRPGRFDRHVVVPLPDIRGRKQILKLYTKNIPLAKDVDLDVLARATPGMSGAELSNLVNEGALKASLAGKTSIDMKSLEFAKDKILMGVERKSAVISPESAKLTAYHEGGHALVALKTEGAHPVYKATIMPRGQALGMVTQLPEGDQTSVSRKEMLARLDVCMGGRVAEEIIFGEDSVTGGASSDIKQATNLARQMITKYGMNTEIGLVYHDLKTEETSSQTKKIIDDEVKKLCERSYERAKKILSDNKNELKTLAEALIKYETLSGKEIQDVLQGKTIERKE